MRNLKAGDEVKVLCDKNLRDTPCRIVNASDPFNKIAVLQYKMMDGLTYRCKVDLNAIKKIEAKKKPTIFN